MHSTHEFYRQRALITRRLIAERGFRAVAVEADWPDAYQVNRFVREPADGVTASGVIDRPESERASHYFHTRIAEQVDAMVHIDETRAVEPLERDAGWLRGAVPETFPTGQ